MRSPEQIKADREAGRSAVTRGSGSKLFGKEPSFQSNAAPAEDDSGGTGV